MSRSSPVHSMSSNKQWQWCYFWDLRFVSNVMCHHWVLWFRINDTAWPVSASCYCSLQRATRASVVLSCIEYLLTARCGLSPRRRRRIQRTTSSLSSTVGVSSFWHTTSAATAEMHRQPDQTIVKCHRSPPRYTAGSIPSDIGIVKKTRLLMSSEQRPLATSRVFDILRSWRWAQIAKTYGENNRYGCMF